MLVSWIGLIFWIFCNFFESFGWWWWWWLMKTRSKRRTKKDDHEADTTRISTRHAELSLFLNGLSLSLLRSFHSLFPLLWANRGVRREWRGRKNEMNTKWNFHCIQESLVRKNQIAQWLRHPSFITQNKIQKLIKNLGGMVLEYYDF